MINAIHNGNELVAGMEQLEVHCLATDRIGFFFIDRVRV
jgi:hypothetical protein